MAVQGDRLRGVAFFTILPVSFEESVAISGAGCSRMGLKTLEVYRSSPTFWGRAEDMVLKDPFVDRPEVWPAEIQLLTDMAERGLQEPLLDAAQIVTCGFMIPQQGAVTQGEWEAMADGLRSRFGDVVFQPGTAGPDTFGLGEWDNQLKVGAAHDPVTRVGCFGWCSFQMKRPERPMRARS